MARTIGHNMDRYVGDKLLRKELRDRRIGSRVKVRTDLRLLAVKGR